MLMISVADVVAYHYHLGPAHQEVQLQREVFSPRVLSLVGTMVLNAEL